MDKKRPLDDDDVIPASPQVQISKRSRTLKVLQVENPAKTKTPIELDFAEFFNEDFDFEFKENVTALDAEPKVSFTPDPDVDFQNFPIFHRSPSTTST
jgi:hypothetical protein